MCAPISLIAQAFKKSDLVENLTALQGKYIGYSVIRPVSDRCLGRTVIDPYKVGRHINNGFYVLRTEVPKSSERTAVGCLWLSLHVPRYGGDGVRAHGAVEHLPVSFRALHRVSRNLPYDFIAGTRPTNGRTAPYRGMTYTDYSRLLIQFGCHPHILVMRSPFRKATRRRHDCPKNS